MQPDEHAEKGGGYDRQVREVQYDPAEIPNRRNDMPHLLDGSPIPCRTWQEGEHGNLALGSS
ncbi:MAG: hypothetical protein ACLQNE_10735 [Thermoguttaceae bacterium]